MRGLGVGTALVLLDQATKFTVDSFLHQSQSIAIIPRVFHLTLVYNTGTAFGLFRNQNLILAGAAALAVAALLYLYARLPQGASVRGRRFWQAGVLCILSGAIGNLIDRLRLGYVIDFIDLRVWPVFNVADSLITVGVGLLICVLVWEGRDESGGTHPGCQKRGDHAS